MNSFNLKTLEELKFKGSNEDYFYNLNVLRSEAIKWIKIFNEECKDKTSADELNKINDKYNLNFIPDLGCAVYILPEWIKHFFNISEDDLK